VSDREKDVEQNLENVAIADIAEAAMTEADTDAGASRATRDLKGAWRFFFLVACGLYSLFYVWTAQRGIISPQTHRGIFVGGATVLILIKYPATKWGAGKPRPSYLDMLLAVAATLAFGYFVVSYETLVTRAGIPTQPDVYFGVIAVVLALEVTRRTVGVILTGLGSFALLYVFIGPSMPGLFRHGGYSFNRLLANQFMAFNGLFGVIADVFATYVLLFIIFGTVMKVTGAAQFFVDLPYALAGRVRGGPAKAALFVSALMGSITGSAVANIMTTGVFTIPVMRRTGYSREFAGGVETAASTGGAMLPPIMGAGIFIMAELTSTPYATIVRVSIIPAILYFAAVYFLIDFEALKRGLKGLERRELENPWTVLKDGWVNFVPIVVVFTLIIQNYSPAFAAFYGIIAGVIAGIFPYRGRRARFRDYVEGLARAGETSLTVGGVVGTIGILIGVLNLTGLGLKFTDIIVGVSGGNLFYAIVLVTLASWVLGAGLTATSSYVIVAIIAGPALVQIGLPILVAHLIIFWVSQDANVTPPIAVAAFAAASIAKSRPMRTAVEAWKLARGLYIVPLLMAYSPLITGELREMLTVGGTGLIGIYAFSAGMSGYLRRPAGWTERTVLMASGVLLIWPGWLTNLAGGILLIAMWYFQRLTPDLGPETAATRAAAAEAAAAEAAKPSSTEA
jgi:TRAP transporter 4TM/12TM fusion protein